MCDPKFRDKGPGVIHCYLYSRFLVTGLSYRSGEEKTTLSQWNFTRGNPRVKFRVWGLGVTSIDGLKRELRIRTVVVKVLDDTCCRASDTLTRGPGTLFGFRGRFWSSGDG